MSPRARRTSVAVTVTAVAAGLLVGPASASAAPTAEAARIHDIQGSTRISPLAGIPGGDATTPVKVETEDGKAALSTSPGRIEPGSDVWKDSRKPLVGQFAFRGRPVFVVANHFNSKGGDQGRSRRGRGSRGAPGSQAAWSEGAASARGRGLPGAGGGFGGGGVPRFGKGRGWGKTPTPTP